MNTTRFEPAANGIPSSVFFPQTDPEERLSQCSASLQALLALSPTTLHALSKLVSNVEISDDIIGVMRNVVAQYPPKGNAVDAKTNFNDLDHGHNHTHSHARSHGRSHGHDHAPEVVEPSVEVPLSVRLWRVSGCHELLASLGFDLMEVGQDQVTLRTGKQANRRNCQFVLQALLALFDTQEAPKSLGIDSSSSCESLNDDVLSEVAVDAPSAVPGTSNNLQQRSVSPVSTVKSLNLKMPRPPLPTHRAPLLGRGSAFISYVRKRGEPDGGRVEPPNISQPMLNGIDTTTSLNNMTDSEFSDGYSSQTMNKFEPKPKMGYSSLRTPIKVGRPGGGGESDAAFTPSPPVTLQSIDSNVSLALAHQTRIRNLYSAANSLNDGHMGDMQLSGCQRPDSSSSASSTNEWDGSGHATVLRRAQHHQSQQILPPMPPPRHNLPLVDSLRPLAPSAPVYHNPKKMPPPINTSSIICTTAIESTSSDSEFDRFDKNDRVPPTHKQMSQQPYITQKMCEEIILMDRLSVRTEISNNVPSIMASVRKPSSTIIEDDETVLSFKLNANNLYFAPNDSDSSHEFDAAATNEKTLTKANAKDHRILLKAHNKNIPDSILRHREMTPTISEVYHERNLGLGLAPPLSKLLLSKNYEENDPKPIGNITETVAEINPSAALLAADLTNNQRCIGCNAINDCTCNTSAKKSISSSSSSTKSWLSLASSNKIPKNESTENSEMIEMQTKCALNGGSGSSDADAVTSNGKHETAPTTSKRRNSPFSDLSRRDEGDGRSVADSQCSGNYKVVDLSSTANKVSDIQERINKFNMNANSTT